MRFFFNAPLTHGRAKSHFINKHVVLYYGSNLLHLLKKGKHNRGKTREIFFYFFLKLHIFRLSGGVSCWLLPVRAFSRGNLRDFDTPTSRNLAAKRSTDFTANCADVVRVSERTQRTPVEFCMRDAPKFNKICSTFARFLAKICAIWEKIFMGT